jgi:uncharacterized protein YcbK (DUF882 family)
MSVSRFFNQKDFDKCNPVCKIEDMDKVFMAMLDTARGYSGDLAASKGDKCVYVLTSAYRTPEHEKKQGRPGTSSHTKRVAVDIACPDSKTFYYVISGLLKAGFTRIGINHAKGFVHVDSDRDKPANLIFGY